MAQNTGPSILAALQGQAGRQRTARHLVPDKVVYDNSTTLLSILWQVAQPGTCTEPDGPAVLV